MTYSEAWDAVVGMSWPWEYCGSGTAAENAAGLQDWYERTGRGRPSLKVCRRVAAEIRRQSRESLSETAQRVGVGAGPGQVRFP